MRVFVPDASVLLKWVLPSEGEASSAIALQIRDAYLRKQIELVLPSLWIYEVGNTLSRKFPEQAGLLLKAFLDFELEEFPTSEEWVKKALYLTQRYQVTFYDASYHALALLLKGRFVTADEKYVRKAGKAGALVALEDWSL